MFRRGTCDRGIWRKPLAFAADADGRFSEVPPCKTDEHPHASGDENKGNVLDIFDNGEGQLFLILALFDLRIESHVVFGELTIERSEIDSGAIVISTEFCKRKDVVPLSIHLLLFGFDELPSVDSENIERESPVAIHSSDH